MNSTRIDILGGTFDPVHTGHVDTALAAQRTLDLDHVLNIILEEAVKATDAEGGTLTATLKITVRVRS